MSGDVPFMSKLRAVSEGVVSENKALSENRISVVPIELACGVMGDLIDEIDELETSGVDIDGKEYTVTLKTSSSIIATWLPMGSNRVTPPNVRRGMRVRLYQFADVDHYYWTSMGLDDDLMRLETVIYAWSATSDEKAELNLMENMYSVEISTHNKAFTLRTSKANGEPFGYVIQLNAAKGIFVVADDIGNVTELNSAEHKIKSINADQTMVELIKKVANVYAKDEVNSTCDGSTTVKTKTNLTADAGANVNVTAGADLFASSVGKATVKGDGGIYLIGPGISMTMENGVMNVG